MGSKSLCDFTQNIRTHATVVGVLFLLATIGSLLTALVLYLEEDKLPKNVKIDGLKELFLAAGIIEFVFNGLYWIGYLKRVRWCLTVIVVLLVIAITLMFIGLFGAIVQLNLSNVCIELTVLAVNSYKLQVTRQLRTANSELSETQEAVSVEACKVIATP